MLSDNKKYATGNPRYDWNSRTSEKRVVERRIRRIGREKRKRLKIEGMGEAID
ncbi:hypothetical protein HanIR_Chr00c18g0909591 [Helianthus annuus]|nr:hypothetical protein HanIR_Chr00c18g0909591 [Helianthus annuus]